MRRLQGVSFILNLVLFGAVLLLLASQRKLISAKMTAPPATDNASVENSVTASKIMFESAQRLPSLEQFRWSQLQSTNDYRRYVLNLRAIGCPESTLRDIVSGDVTRAFAYKRHQLRTDGTGTGLWSQANEAKVLAGYLGEQPPETGNLPTSQTFSGNAQPTSQTQAPASATASPGSVPPPGMAGSPVNYSPVYPLVFRKVDLTALRFGAEEKTAIAQVQQQFLTDIGGYNQSPSDPGYLARWQTAQVNADDALRGALGAEAFMAYEQQLYYDWYQPQITAADAGGGTLNINPALFTSGQ